MVKDFRFLQVRVDPALMESLKNAAWQRRTSVTQLVTTVLSAFVAAIETQESVANSPDEGEDEPDTQAQS